MQMCPNCDKVYDESEYSSCPYCSGELKSKRHRKIKDCPECGAVMHWEGDCWQCTDCGHECDDDED